MLHGRRFCAVFQQVGSMAFNRESYALFSDLGHSEESGASRFSEASTEIPHAMSQSAILSQSWP